jgi:hypothetical protein
MRPGDEGIAARGVFSVIAVVLGIGGSDAEHDPRNGANQVHRNTALLWWTRAANGEPCFSTACFEHITGASRAARLFEPPAEVSCQPSPVSS